jgi:hypothetical protein
MNAIKRIAPKQLGFSTAKIKDALFGEGKVNGSTAHLYSVVGIMAGIKTGQSDFGPWTKLIGEFVATLPDGTQFSSAQCFLPNFVTDQAVAAFQSGEGRAVDFGFDIGVLRIDDAAVGYEYTATPRVAIEQSNRMAHLLERAGIENANGTAPQLTHETAVKNAPRAAAKKTAPRSGARR